MIKNREDLVIKYIKDEMAVFNRIDIGVIHKLIAALEKARKRESTVYVCGNGGSALTAVIFRIYCKYGNLRTLTKP